MTASELVDEVRNAIQDALKAKWPEPTMEVARAIAINGLAMAAAYHAHAGLNCEILDILRRAARDVAELN